MLYREKTDSGKIKYDEIIIGNIARRVISGTDGRAVASDAKGRLVKGGPGPGSNDDQIVDAQFHDGVLDVKMYIVIRFGSSISKVIEDIDRSFRAAVPAVTGAEVGDFSIFVKGLLSKNISKRNIEVTTHAGDDSSS
ncbi:MAG: Asp23/Gls24 family envelope stress response protein [Clostridiales Family XIII bacterium]|jgi:uncharacterized alkaline shock family protein YloU|nr:Asp23/Gls24 family envelope stress response protein [Clostridiales Family XIII bacterium]